MTIYEVSRDGKFQCMFTDEGALRSWLKHPSHYQQTYDIVEVEVADDYYYD